MDLALHSGLNTEWISLYTQVEIQSGSHSTLKSKYRVDLTLHSSLNTEWISLYTQV